MAALDAQSNWNVEMAQPLRLTAITKSTSPKPPSPIPTILFSKSTHEVFLPSEIISHILSYIPRKASSQSIFWACTLVSRTWYSAAISLLYERPYLGGGNFNKFVETVCPSKNAHIRQSALAVLVRRLDMGELVHNANRSLTARLLSRVKGNIEEFVAPQTSFSINSLAALSKCTKLRYLNLSLISAWIPNKNLFQTLESLQNLETLFFPRSSSTESDDSNVHYKWPSRLRSLHLAGGAINNFFLTHHLSNLPSTLATISIQHCPRETAIGLKVLLEKHGSQLQELTIRHPMQHLWRGALNEVLYDCPNLTALRISADYITDELFSMARQDSALRILDLECSPTAEPDVEITANAIFEAVDMGQLPDLRSVRVSSRLAWDATKRTKVDAKDLSDLLVAMETEKPLGVLAGVWWNMPD